MGAGGQFRGGAGRALRREGREAKPCADVIETNSRGIVAREMNERGTRLPPMAPASRRAPGRAGYALARACPRIAR